MRLAEITDGIGGITVTGATDIEINGLTADSRDVRAGHLFAAFPGKKMDGRAYIDAAVKAGATAVLVPKGTQVSHPGIAVIECDNPRQAFARIAANFFGEQMETIVAVTGTNGKSTIVNFCRQIWRAMDHAAASLGTIGIIADLSDGTSLNRTGSLTTPDPVTLHSEIAELEKAGVTHLAMEASSQGLDQYRLDGVKVTAAAFTNLTRDHLDYHGTMDVYFEAKLRLFTEILAQDGVAIVNSDIPEFQKIADACHARGIRVIDFGEKAQSLKLVSKKPLTDGQFIEIEIFGEKYQLELPLVGDFQVMNALTAIGLVIASDPDNRLLHMQAVHALETLTSVRGRLELAAKLPNGAAIYVDYAHTPDGLETMLQSLKPHANNKLHVVFGCGGDRDKGKRPMMGEIAARLADSVIVTDDNPRTEDAATIRREVMGGCPKATEIAGRREAIAAAIRNLGPDDILVVAGKGHEQGQIVGDKVLPFDDVTEVKKATEALKNEQASKSPVDQHGNRKGNGRKSDREL